MASPSIWLPLESNPEVLNTYMERLGVGGDWAFTDIYGLDPELLDMVPKPVIAILMLFPITETYESYRREEEAKLKSGPIDFSGFFCLQKTANACGTIALLHALANNSEKIDIETGPLKRILDRMSASSPEERGRALEFDDDLVRIHEETSHEGQSQVPDREDDVDLHFVCFVQKDGMLFELDGRKPCPVNHGRVNDFVANTAAVVQQFMARDPENLQFTLMALSPANAA
ncbi:ubiquitin carboxyl-terminal esterase L3 [Cladochytrium replicatum]|nr:ubiquitin carboxyl-terminal esterase L3 [Cladochytrium replicatum]